MSKLKDERNALAAKLVSYARVLWIALDRDPDLAGQCARLGVDVREVEGLAGGGADGEQRRRERAP